MERPLGRIRILNKKPPIENTRNWSLATLALPTAYLTMVLLVAGMAFYFSQLLDHARNQAVHRLTDHTKIISEEIDKEITRLEDIGLALSSFYFETSLFQNEDVAHKQILDNIKLHMVGGHFEVKEARVHTPEGHLTTVSFDEDGNYHLESEMSTAPSLSDNQNNSWLVSDGTCTLRQVLKGSGPKRGLLELVFSTEELMSGINKFNLLSDSGRLWWIDPNGIPGKNAFESSGDLSPQMTKSLMSMLDQLQNGVIETDCPWHQNHKAYTALAPVFIGDYDLAVLSTMDASKIMGSQIRLGLILGALFACLLLLAVLVLKLNINQRKTALQKLADEKAVIEGLFHSIDDLIFQQDLNGVYTDCNQSFADFQGRTPHQIRGRTDQQLGIPEDQIPITEKDRHILKKAKRLASEVWMKNQMGSEELVDLHKHPLQHLDGTVYGVIGIGRVKTGQWRSEQHLLELKEELEEANRNMEEALTRANLFSSEAEKANKAKSEFLANMSHEIRTPLGAVIGLTDLLTQTNCTKQQLGYLKKLDNSAQSLLGIINDILDFSKIEAGKMTFEITPFHLGEVISQVTEMFSERVMARNLYFINKREQIPELLLGDPVRLRQILVNLLGNALKFTEKGGITLKVSGDTRMGQKVFLVFSVVDTGIGIPADKLDDLFSSFSQADTSTTRQFGGTGLGLSISQQLVELMGGNIWVESTVGEGTTFHFSLPFEEMDEETANAFMEELFNQENGIATQPGKPLAEVVVLLVDDNEINREVISEILRQRGAIVSLAENGSQAIETIAKKDFHIVLMDMQMPVMDGPTATKEIRTDLSSEELPILALTANAQAEDKRLCLASGMDDYMAKPVDPAELVDKILALIKNQPRIEQVEIVREEKNEEMDPQIPGINLPEVMKRLGNKKELFTKLMKMFVNQHSEDITLIDKALASGDRQQAIHLAHALKGTAGNLSANNVQHSAAELENLLRSDAPLPQVSPQNLQTAMAEVVQTMEKLLTSVKETQVEKSTPKPSADRSQIIKTLKMLNVLIAENNVSTEDEFLAHRPELEGSIPAMVLDNISQALMMFEFEEANHLITGLIEEMTTSTV